MRKGKPRIDARVSPAVFKEINDIIKSGAYSSKSDFVQEAIIEKIADIKADNKLREKIIDLIKNDPEIREEIKKI